MNEFDRVDPSNPHHEPLLALLQRRRLDWRGISLSGLRTSYEDFDVACRPFLEKDDGWHADRWVGSFRLNRRTFKIVPRIGWNRFFWLLTEVLTASSIKAGSTAGTVTDNIMADFLALAWTVATRQGRRRNGIAKAYIRREVMDSPVLRGQLDLVRQLVDKRVDRQTLACTYDDLTFDNPINRGTRMVIPHLNRRGRFPFHRGKTHGAAVELKQWQERLEMLGVQESASYPRDSVRWSRANDGYRTAHALGERLVRGHGFRVGEAAIDEAILVDSAEVWEMYLLRRLQTAIQRFPGYEVVSPRLHRRDMDWLLVWQGRKAIAQIPDFQIRRIQDGSVVAVLDAKYRRFTAPSEDEGVALQMARYSTTAGQRNETVRPVPCALLYPVARTPKGGSGLCEQSGTGLNENLENGPIGEGYFLMGADAPRLIAWAIDLPEPLSRGEAADHHRAIDEELARVIDKLLEQPGPEDCLQQGGFHVAR